MRPYAVDRRLHSRSASVRSQGDGWYSWLHYTTDLTPEQRDIMVPVYAKPREVTWMGQPKVAEGRWVRVRVSASPATSSVRVANICWMAQTSGSGTRRCSCCLGLHIITYAAHASARRSVSGDAQHLIARSISAYSGQRPGCLRAPAPLF